MKKIIFLIVINHFALSIYAQIFTGYTKYNSGLSNNNVYAVAIDKFGNKWLALDSCFMKYDGQNWYKWYVTVPSANLSKSVKCILIDKYDNKWIGTGYGLIKFDGTNITRYTTSNSGLCNNRVQALAIDSSNNLWVGTYFGASKFDGVNGTTLDNSHEFIAIAVEPYGNHAVWLAPSYVF